MVTVVPWAEQLIAALHQPHTQSLSLLLFLLDARAILDLLERVAASSDPHSVKCTGVDGELDLPEALQHFSAYLDELYLAFSVAADAARSRERPFHLAALASNDVDDGPLDDAAKFTARLCSLYKLASTLDGASTFAQSLDSLPEPDISLQSTMIQSLVNRRASQPPVTVGRTRSVGALRWVLASLLKHYLGEDHFGQHSSADHAGSIRYAKRDADDAAIRARFPRTLLEEQQRRSSTTGLQRRTSAGSVASTGTTATTGAVQASAEEQRAKRDDKLRWLFGENVNSKTLIIARSYAAAPSSPSSRVLSPTSPLFAPPTPRYVRHPAQTPLSPPHRRAWSAGSEVAPSPSSAIFGRRTPTLGDPTHRKSVPSLDDTDADAESALSSSRGTSSSDLRRYDSIDTVDSRTALLPAPTARNAAPRQHIPYVGPFQSALVRIDDASPESSPPQPLDAPAFTDTRSGALRRSLSTRSEPAHGSPATAAMCFEDDDDDDASTLPSNTNNLSAAEKATLVRKSRKLKAVLGELVRDDQLLLSPAALANRRPAAPPPAGLSVQSSPYVVGADDDSEGEEKTPVPITAPTSPETRLFPDDGGESSAMSRASSAAFFGTDRHGDHTDAFTSPDMALGLKSPDVDPDSRAEVELDEYARRGSAATFQTAAAPLSPRSINTFSSEGDSPRMPAQARQASRTSMADAKEARRRKLMKVQAFLGERVPVSALSDHTGHHILRANAQPLVHSAPLTPIASSHGLGLGIASGASSNGDRKSKRTTKLLSKASTRLLRSKSGYAGISDAAGKGHVSADDQQQQRERAPKRAPSSRRLSKKPERAESGAEAATAPTGTSADWAYVRVEPGAAHESEKHKRNTLAVTGVSGGAVAEGADPAITAIRRARKLEKMFGSLPPAQMYSSRRPAQILAPRKLVPRDDRPRPLSFARASSSDRVLKSSSSTATSSLYRRSVASLRYIAESGDRNLLDDLARVVMAEEGEEEALRVCNGQAGHADDRASVQGDVSSTDDELGLPLIAAAGSQVEPPTRQGKTSYGSTTDEDESLLGGGRSSIDTTASLPAGFAYPSTSARLRSHPQLAHLYNPQRGSRGGTASRAGRDSAMSGVTVHSSADSAFDIGSPRSHSRASSSAGDDADPLAGAGVNGRSSMESVRIHFRRAHKLARVLGTTRGEVFNKVLDDIEADLAEDENEELDPLERRDILENVAALRASL